MQPQTYEQIYGNLNQFYNPQRQAIQAQQAQIPGMYQVQTTALEQAKANAFRDIASTARGRGVAFGGYTPSEQARFTGEKFLPALAAIKNEQLTRQNALADALLALNAKQGSEAQSNYTSQQNALADAQAKREAALIAAQARIQAAGISASSKSPALTKFTAKDVINKDTGKKTGTNFYGQNGQPVTAAQYYSGIGGSIDDLYTFLQNDIDKTSKKAAADLKKAGGLTPALVAKYPWIFGG